MPRHVDCLPPCIDLRVSTNPEENRPNGALDPADRRRSHRAYQPRVPRRRSTPNATGLFRAKRAESEGGAPVGALLLHHGGGVLLPAGRGDPAVAGGEWDARHKGARHAGGPGPGGGGGTRRAEEETSLVGVPGAPNRLEKVLPGDVQEEGTPEQTRRLRFYPPHRLSPLSAETESLIR